ncbi:hypothetical protein Tco_0315905 [Tanacetum coccineum]
MSKVLQERGFGSLPSSTEVNPRDQVRSISTTIEADSYLIRRIGSSQYAVSTGQNHILMYETRQMTILFPRHLNGSSISVIPLSTYLNLGLGELAHTKLTVELADRTMKYPKRIAKNVLVGIGKFVFPVNFILLDMPEDIKVPLILRRPFLSPALAKIDVYKRNITLRVEEERIVFISVKTSSSLIKRVYMLSLREIMELDLEARLMGETLECDVIEEFRTRDDELDAGTDDYPILENMDAYRDEGMGDVIFGEPFLREVGINTKRFEGMIIIYNGNNEVTYQMVRSHPKFKHHTNEQCNKIPPLLKVSKEDKMNGISDPYQKLKGFYKGVLNLGPSYIRDAKMEEWLIHRHISVHEIE